MASAEATDTPAAVESPPSYNQTVGSSNDDHVCTLSFNKPAVSGQGNTAGAVNESLPRQVPAVFEIDLHVGEGQDRSRSGELESQNRSLKGKVRRGKVVWASLAALSLGLVVHVVALATPHWLTYNIEARIKYWRHDYGLVEWDVGLWRKCQNTGLRSDCERLADAGFDAHWITALQAMQCLALMGLVVSLILMLLGVCAKCVNVWKKMRALAGTTAILSGLLIYISISILLFKILRSTQATSLGYSFALSVIAGFCAILSGILSIISR